MASFVYTPIKTKLATGGIDLESVDFRVLLLKTSGNTSADTDQDAEFIDDITSLGEISATNYVRKAVTGEVVTQDDANNRAEFSFDAVTWTTLGGAANDTIGALLYYIHVTNDTDSLPFAYVDGAIFQGGQSSLTTNGSDVTLTPNVQGAVQVS